MKTIINLVLLALIGVLAWVLIGNIREPIKFQEVKKERKNAIIDKLENIREAQELYRGIKGEYAGNFDELRRVLQTENFKLVRVLGDPDDPNNPEAVIYDTILKPAIDSITTIGLVLEKMEVIPYSDNKTFDIAADTITYQQTTVPVVQVGTNWATFMGEFASPKFTKYDSSYDPNARFQFGSLDAPNLGGTWD